MLLKNTIRHILVLLWSSFPFKRAFSSESGPGWMWAMSSWRKRGRWSWRNMKHSRRRLSRTSSGSGDGKIWTNGGRWWKARMSFDWVLGLFLDSCSILRDDRGGHFLCWGGDVYFFFSIDHRHWHWDHFPTFAGCFGAALEVRSAEKDAQVGGPLGTRGWAVRS